MNPDDKEILKSGPKSLRTYQGDVDEILSKGKASASTILIAEQKRKESTIAVPVNYQKSSTIKNKFFIIIGISLFILGAIAISSIYYLKTKEEVAVIQKTKALIAYSKETIIPVAGNTRETLIKNIIKEKDGIKISANYVLFINTTDTTDETSAEAPLEKVLSLLAPKMPSVLSRSFEPKYMLGVYSFDKNRPFIILTLNDYPSSYAGMLKWEKDMLSDLGPIFEIPQDETSSSYIFTDEALKNKDLRILKNENKETLLLYSFIDRNTLLITSSEDIFNAIIGKYLINKTVR